MTALTVEVVQTVVSVGVEQKEVDMVEVLHPGPRGLNAFDIDGGSASTVYSGAILDVIDGGGA
jgi:hypothetical protein